MFCHGFVWNVKRTGSLVFYNRNEYMFGIVTIFDAVKLLNGSYVGFIVCIFLAKEKDTVIMYHKINYTLTHTWAFAFTWQTLWIFGASPSCSFSITQWLAAYFQLCTINGTEQCTQHSVRRFIIYFHLKIRYTIYHLFIPFKSECYICFNNNQIIF